jgi:DNA-binding response OmpR family regulator
MGVLRATVMPNVTVLLRPSVDWELHQMATSRDSSVDALVNAALSEYLKSDRPSTGRALEDHPPPIKIGRIELDPARRVVRKAGGVVRLTPKEFELLHYLMQHAGFPIAHGRLLRAVWGAEYGNESEYLRTYIRQLRKKLEDEPAEPKYLLTEPCFGYRMIDVIDADEEQ